MEEGDGYRCNSCAKYLSTCKVNYILNFKIVDGTGGIWVTAFEP